MAESLAHERKLSCMEMWAGRRREAAIMTAAPVGVSFGLYEKSHEARQGGGVGTGWCEAG